MNGRLAILAWVLASVPAAAMAQDTRAQAVPYCPDLQRVVALAMSKERFASIAGKPRALEPVCVLVADPLHAQELAQVERVAAARALER